MRNLVLAMTALCFASLADAQTPPPVEITADEIVVMGERPGPGMWRILGPGAEVYILPIVQPLPKGFVWNSKPVDAVLARTDRALVGQGAVSIGLGTVVRQRDTIRNPDDGKISAYLDAATRTRWDAARRKLGWTSANDLENWRPYIAGFMLSGRAFERAGLSSSNDVFATVSTKLRKKRVRIDNVLRLDNKAMVRGFNDMPGGADTPCLIAALDLVEKGIPATQARAVAWAKGDIALLRRNADAASGAACLSAMDAGGVPAAEFIETFKTAWVNGLSSARNRPGVTLAVISAVWFLEPDGVLDRLRAAGVVVEDPPV
jgi:uncharacterized protein YbaP (TraB family)